MSRQISRLGMTLWQIIYLLLSVTWLFAPLLNTQLSYRGSLISQYETPGQPYSALFRLGDFFAGLMIIGLIFIYYRSWLKKLPVIVLLIAALGMLLDPILTTSCSMHGNICQETFSFKFVLHAIETTITAAAIMFLAVYDSVKRKKLVSISFVVFQIGYGILFMTQLADQEHFGTASQFVYQCAVVLWLAWYVADYIFADAHKLAIRHMSIVRKIFAGWTFINGILAIITSLAHIKLLDRIDSIYFAGNGAWLAQHSVLVGIIMIYLARHIARGEIRARQILLAIFGGEVIKYSVITPHLGLLILYLLSFAALFALRDDFKIGTTSITWDIRLKDLSIFVIGLFLAATLMLVTLNRNKNVSAIAHKTSDNFYDFVIQPDGPPKSSNKIQSALLAHTTTIFLALGSITAAYILFRPYKRTKNSFDEEKIKTLLVKYSDNTEDYFKLWPDDKEYFINEKGFVAYKVVGNTAFALPDPISLKVNKLNLVKDFVDDCLAKRLVPVFLAVQEPSLEYYKELKSIQIGANAIVNTHQFIEATIKNKWWRWKLNKATKQGYVFKKSLPPHSLELLSELKNVSDDWLKMGHQERGFALGYFDNKYINSSEIIYLEDASSNVVAFINKLPEFNSNKTASIDLLRYKAEATESMPMLLANFIKSINDQGYIYFDLGFVPFAKTSGQIQSIAKILSTGRFSSKGLEQFKNKFEPDWKNNYLVYSGDLGDLATIVAYLESAMKI